MKYQYKGEMYMSMIPFENYNQVITGNNLNELFIDIINPYGFMTNFAVEVIAPTYPSSSTEDPDEPTYGLNDFLIWARPFKEYLNEGADSAFYPLWLVLLELGKTKVRWSVIKEATVWKRLISLYIAHYMETTLKTWKDEANTQSLNPENPDAKIKVEMVVNDLVANEYMKSMYGQMFWHEYREFGRYADGIWGLHI